MKISENVPISSLTTMHLGGPARYVIEIEDKSEIKKAYDFAREKNLPTFVLGGGANTLGHDEGFNGVIIKNCLTGIQQNPLQQLVEITAMGGEVWDNVVAYACEKGLTGIEALSKIPGLAGAAPVQNIGAYGQEISDTLKSIEVYDSKTDEFCTLTNSELNFSYRKSILNTTAKNRYFVVSITLTLKPGQMPRPFYISVEKYIEDNNVTDLSPQSLRNIISFLRDQKIPDVKTHPSSGSFFKNIYLDEAGTELAKSKGYPVFGSKDGNNINSGWLIENAGLAGQLLHGFRVNEKAALVLINESAKSYQDLIAARDEIIAKIYELYGYKLEQEPVELA